MAKSKILKELANNEIDLEVAVSRLMIISSDIGNEKLYKWAESELNGYTSSDNLPEYRNLEIGHIVYSGLNGRMLVTNQPIPITAFSSDELDLITGTSFPHSIRAIQQFAQQDKKEEISKDLTFLASSFSKRQGVRCTSIKMLYGSADVLSILSNIRTKLISVFIKLDKEFGCLDNLDVDIQGINAKKLDSINADLSSIIYSDDKAEVG